LLCALEGKYLVQDSCYDLVDADAAIGHNELQHLSFSCRIPNVTGRGFIEVVYSYNFSCFRKNILFSLAFSKVYEVIFAFFNVNFCSLELDDACHLVTLALIYFAGPL